MIKGILRQSVALLSRKKPWTSPIHGGLVGTPDTITHPYTESVIYRNESSHYEGRVRSSGSGELDKELGQLFIQGRPC